MFIKCPHCHKLILMKQEGQPLRSGGVKTTKYVCTIKNKEGAWKEKGCGKKVVVKEELVKTVSKADR